MRPFTDWQEELAFTQAATEELLQEIAMSGAEVDDRTIGRLDRLSTTCARLAFGHNDVEALSPQVYNLLMWCDHLDDTAWRDAFKAALRRQPLVNPFAS
jgi:hypothetical protein